MIHNVRAHLRKQIMNDELLEQREQNGTCSSYAES